MSKPHHKPVNVSLTGIARLSAPQRLGGELVPAGDLKDWRRDEAMELSRAALERMIANGWTGYGKKKKTVQRKLSEKEVRAWMVANRDLATRMMTEVWR